MRKFVPDEAELESDWREFIQSGIQHVAYPMSRNDGEIRFVEYTAVSSILQGQHLAILRDMTEYVESRVAPGSGSISPACSSASTRRIPTAGTGHYTQGGMAVLVS
jgi:hypothetical protein